MSKKTVKIPKGAPLDFPSGHAACKGMDTEKFVKVAPATFDLRELNPEGAETRPA